MSRPPQRGLQHVPGNEAWALPANIAGAMALREPRLLYAQAQFAAGVDAGQRQV